LRKACVERAITYTRYADDMFFSTLAPNILGEIPDLVATTLKTLKYPGSLQVNASKTRHSSLKRRRRVTGLVVSTQGTISIGRRLKRRTRSLVHNFNSLDGLEKSRLSGWLAYIRDVEPAFFNRLVVKYGKRVALAARMTNKP
jgi:RNA-directed DNA polymerase